MNTDLRTELRSVILGAIIGLIISACAIYSRQANKPDIEPIKPVIEPIECEAVKYVEAMPVYEVVEPNLEEELYYDSLEYLACCVEAEAGNQDAKGKMLVCDVILNRVDNMHFPNTITGVINQEGQFSVVENGMINKVSVSDETFNICKLELIERSDTEILYFKTGDYHTIGTPAYRYGDHYFSKE